MQLLRCYKQTNECVNTIHTHSPCCIVFIICMLRFKQQGHRLFLDNSNCLSLMILTGWSFFFKRLSMLETRHRKLEGSLTFNFFIFTSNRATNPTRHLFNSAGPIVCTAFSLFFFILKNFSNSSTSRLVFALVFLFSVL